MKFCVVGAGIIGASTAIQLKITFPQSQVTVIAENVSPDRSLTSDGSGGFWQPHLIRGTSPEKIK